MLAPEPPPATHQLDMSAESHLFVMLNHSTVHQQACGWIASTSQPIAFAIYHQADRFFCHTQFEGWGSCRSIGMGMAE